MYGDSTSQSRRPLRWEEVNPKAGTTDIRKRHAQVPLLWERAANIPVRPKLHGQGETGAKPVQSRSPWVLKARLKCSGI